MNSLGYFGNKSLFLKTMTLTFQVSLLNYKKIQNLENSWTLEDYKKLLEIMDYGDSSDLSDQELKEMCLLSLADAESDESATILLNYIFSERLNSGQIDNLSHEMLEEKMWEEYADLALHEEFFNVHQLLYDAYNGKFPNPEAIELKVEISAASTEMYESLEQEPEATLLRILVQGVDQNNIISRLFEAELAGESFKDAKNIIWQFKKEKANEGSYIFTLISSSYLFNDFRDISSFEAKIQVDN